MTLGVRSATNFAPAAWDGTRPEAVVATNTIKRALKTLNYFCSPCAQTKLGVIPHFATYLCSSNRHFSINTLSLEGEHDETFQSQ